MSSKTCPRCGCTEIDKDAATGGSYCTNCGSVLEENAIVAEVEFFETGSGGHGALGQFVSADAPSKLHIGSLPGISTRASREVTLLKAKRLIDEVASQLRGLNQHCKDVALNFVKLALSAGLTRGRRSTHVIAASLYITCRLEGIPHLLLDFSDVLQVNVFELGRVYNFIARKLLIKLPNVDPCDYVIRFAHCLNFGNKEMEVANVALRLVQRMKRDWISFGRRPTGLCGAALLLAARYHNFNRSVNDIIQVVNISETVIRKRLEEFASTPSSELTLNEFQTVDLEQTCDPPAFRDARNKARRQQQLTAQQQQQTLQPDVDTASSKFRTLEKQLLSKEAEVEAALSTGTKRHPYAKYNKIDEQEESTKSTSKKRPSIKANLDEATSSTTTTALASGDGLVDEDEHVRDFVEQELFSDIIDESMEDESEIDRSAAAGETPAQKFRALRPTLESMGIGKYSATKLDTTDEDDKKKATNDGETEVDDTILNSDDDDGEIDSYLLTADEVRMKEAHWKIHYEEFVKQQEEKRRLKEEERAKEEQLQAEGGGEKKRRTVVRKKKPKDEQGVAATSGEAIEKIMQEKKLSNKINYEVLKSLVVMPTDGDEDAGVQASTSSSSYSIAKEDSIGASPALLSSTYASHRFKPYSVKRPPQPETPALPTPPKIVSPPSQASTTVVTPASSSSTPIPSTTERRFRIGARVVLNKAKSEKSQEPTTDR